MGSAASPPPRTDALPEALFLFRLRFDRELPSTSRLDETDSNGMDSSSPKGHRGTTLEFPHTSRKRRSPP